jgi:sulfate permease
MFAHILSKKPLRSGVILILLCIAFIVALFFAVNIGASGTAATMGAAYGGGALPNRKIAVLLAAVFAFLGANLGGSKVVTTISKGIVSESLITIEITIIILFSACFTLFYANRIGIPLSTSEVTVGSIVGVGLAIGMIQWGTLIFIVGTWIVLPFLSFAIAFFMGRILRSQEQKWMRAYPRSITILLTVILIGTGCYEAFAAGMNNVANAIGPLVGSGLINLNSGILLGSIFMAGGALFMGGKVLETNGKKITQLSLLQGSIVSFTGGSLVIVASLFGIPVPLTQSTTMAIVGVGSEKAGLIIFKNPVVRKIAKVWVLSPVISLLLSFALVQTIIYHSIWFISVLIFLGAAALFVGVFRLKLIRSLKTLKSIKSPAKY